MMSTCFRASILPHAAVFLVEEAFLVCELFLKRVSVTTFREISLLNLQRAIHVLTGASVGAAVATLIAPPAVVGAWVIYGASMGETIAYFSYSSTVACQYAIHKDYCNRCVTDYMLSYGPVSAFFRR